MLRNILPFLTGAVLGLNAPLVHADTELDAVLTTDILSNLSGGSRTGTRLMSNLDLSAAWDDGGGWSAFSYVLVDAGGGFSERYSGDAQVVSNIDAPSGVRLFEAWVRRDADDQSWAVMAGLINLNGVFDVQETGGLFLNASHGIGPDYAQTVPSIFPISGLGLVGEWSPAQSTRLRLGVFDGVPGEPNQKRFTSLRLSDSEGAHVVAEAEHSFSQGYVKLGAWHYSAAAPRLDGAGDDRGNSGWYAQLKYDLYKPDPQGDAGLSGWLRIGGANQDVQAVKSYVGGGLVLTAPFQERASDAVGIALAQARFGDPYAQSLGIGLEPETTWEISYRYEIRSGLSIQPDIQYIQNPGGDPDVDSAVVAGVRLRVGLEAFR